MALYDAIGQQYSQSRTPDRRIVQQLLEFLALPPGSTIADIGAGTGGYSRAIADCGFRVYAIEPSIVMRSQARGHFQVIWITGSAEQIPLPNASVDAAISILSMHHFSNLEQALQEMYRVTRHGHLLFFSFDVRQCQPLWLEDYFPWLHEDALRFPSLNEIATLIERTTGRTVDVFPFLLPYDLSDLFAAAAWRRPELYLNPSIRASISSFAIANPMLVQQGVEQLEADLLSGRWEAKYGSIRHFEVIDAGYRFLRAT